MKRILILSAFALVATAFTDVVRASPGKGGGLASKNEKRFTVVNDEIPVNSFSFKNTHADCVDVFILENESFSYSVAPVKKTIKGAEKSMNNFFETGIGLFVLNSDLEILFINRNKKINSKKTLAWCSEIYPVDYENEKVDFEITGN